MRRLGWAAAMAAGIVACAGVAQGQGLQAGEPTPTGFAITPSAAAGALFQALNPDLPSLPGFTAGQASAVALSPDGKTLLILTSGFNRNLGPDGKAIPAQSSEYVFVYDVSGAAPAKRQVIQVANTFLGIGWAPAGDRFFVSGGMDDNVLEFTGGSSGFKSGRSFALGHKIGLGLLVKPQAAGLAVSPDGKRLLVANIQNDSVSLIDLASGAISELDLRPGKGAAGGTYPRAVAWVSNRKAYVASERDREIIALGVSRKGLAVRARIHTRGQPVFLLASGRSLRLYAALDNTDAVAVIDPMSDRVIEEIPTAAPPVLRARIGHLGGAGSNSLALSADARTLLVTNGGENAVAVVRLSPRAAALAERAPGRKPPTHRGGDGDDDAAKPATRSEVVGLIPTGWYPTGVAIRPDGGQLYVVNGKSNAGPNPTGCRNNLSTAKDNRYACGARNQYVWQLEKAGFLTLPTPSPAELGRLTRQVARNDRFPGAREAGKGEAVMAFLRQHIHHVIYIVKENRTYDQILGDLEVGDGDPKLAIFGRAITPNQHAIAREFVDLDRFFDSGESSNTGWNWTTAARTNDWTEREAPVNYAQRGLQYDQEGANRNVNVALATLAQRRAANPSTPNDANVLPGAVDVAAPDGPDGAAGAGYIWDGALRAGLSVRNWGFYGDLVRYDKDAGAAQLPLDREPWKSKRTVYYAANRSLLAISDPYFRAFDQAFPDFWRYREWEREFDGFMTAGKAPNLMLVRFPHDHTGSFGQAIDGVNTVETEVADNDYAVGMLVEKISKSPIARDTLIFVVEDDAQDGPDHVEAHRSVAFVAGAYVKHGAVISARYTTVNLIRTMEAVLGTAPLGLNDAMAEPMAEAFDIKGSGDWRFEARVPAVLRTTRLPLPPAREACLARPTHDAAWWTAAMKGQDFGAEDRLDTAAYNRALWRGLRGNEPYPAARNGADLRAHRAELLARGTHGDCG